MKGRWERWRERVRSGFWAVPGGCVTAAVLLALLFVEVDHRLQSSYAFTFGAGPDGAREVLSAITTAMITFTGLVFSITVLALQLTSSQFSPRVLRTFLRDRLTQYALGVFTATFVYAVMVLRSVRSDSSSDSDFVPAVSTTVALALLLLSVALFVTYIHHIATSLQVSSVIAAIGTETRATIDRRFPPGRDQPIGSRALPPDAVPALVVPARRSGVVTAVDEQALVRAARDAEVVLRTQVRLGRYVPQGAPLLEVLGDASRLDVPAVLAAVTQERDRTLQADVAFGFRQLVDIAERALSPGINDPTTAVQVLDEEHDLLRRLATRPLRTGVHTDEHGRVRLVVPADALEDYLALAIEEIERDGADMPRVLARVEELLDDVAAAALPEHRSALLRWRSARGSRTRATRTG